MVIFASRRKLAGAGLLALVAASMGTVSAHAQQNAADETTASSTAPAPLSDEEMEVLVARVALYPDELVAVICGASLFPLQIVEAARFLDDRATDSNLSPKEGWDGSVISLLNYPEIVKMMSDDLDWTQALGDALAYQQKDVLIAIQQLRDEAVAKGVIKSDDKIEVVEEDDNVVIKSASPETVYIPQYPPEMLYEPDYVAAPINYYPDPYPHYYYPTAPYFAGFVTGVVWGAVVDWDDWDVWGGHWDSGDIDIDCNDCFNDRDFDGKINFNDVDWRNVDPSKIDIDRNQLANIDRTDIRNNIKANNDTSIGDRAANLRNEHSNVLSQRSGQHRDVRKSTLEGLKGRGDIARPDGNRPQINRPSAGGSSISRLDAKKPTNVHRPSGKKKPAARIDHRPAKPSSLGHVGHSKSQKIASHRGHMSMGGGRHSAIHHAGGGHRAVHHGGGHRAAHHGGRRR